MFFYKKFVPISCAKGSLLCHTSHNGRLAESIILQDSTFKEPSSTVGLTGLLKFSKTSKKSACRICSLRNLWKSESNLGSNSLYYKQLYKWPANFSLSFGVSSLRSFRESVKTVNLSKASTCLYKSLKCPDNPLQ